MSHSMGQTPNINLVFETTNDDTAFVGYSMDETLTESMVIERFNDVAIEGEDLVMVVVDGVKTYTVRGLVTPPEPDEFEYEDNEGNPITSSGEDILESDCVVDDEPIYEFAGDYLWTVREGEGDKVLNYQHQSLFLLDLGSGSPFERAEDLVIISSFRS